MTLRIKLELDEPEREICALLGIDPNDVLGVTITRELLDVRDIGTLLEEVRAALTIRIETKNVTRIAPSDPTSTV